MSLQLYLFYAICLFSHMFSCTYASSVHMPAQSYVFPVHMSLPLHVLLHICLFRSHAYSAICPSCTYVSFVHMPLLTHACPVTYSFSHISLPSTCLFSHMSFLHICLFRPHASSATCLLSHMSLQPTCLVQNILALDRRRQLAYENPLTPF